MTLRDSATRALQRVLEEPGESGVQADLTKDGVTVVGEKELGKGVTAGGVFSRAWDGTKAWAARLTWTPKK